MTRQWLYDRTGTPISSDKFATLHKNVDYKIVEATATDDYTVSTVWLGINHEPDPDKRPKIFETMIFFNNSLADLQWQYSTETEAKEGHAHAMGVAEATMIMKNADWTQPDQ